MKERPILFSAPMVRALLDGTKTQTRRVIVSHKKAAPYFVIYADEDGANPRPVYSGDGERGHYIDAQGYDVEERMQCPYGHTGDRLWVRETHAHMYRGNALPEIRREDDVVYAADGFAPDEFVYGTWKPSIHMPRWASRITLEVTGVKVERLQSISEADAVAEGIPHSDVSPPDMGVFAYRQLWESINGEGSWEANPWVWAISFRRIT